MRRKIGIIGLGDIAEKAYLPVLGSHPGIEIVGIMSRTPATVERIGDAFRIAERHTELRSLLAAGPEAVFIHTPTETHYDIVMECLRSGIHVYVDKPLSYDIRESEQMAEQASRSGKLLGVGFNRRFAPLYARAKDWMDEAGGFELLSAEKHRTRLQRHGAKATMYDDLIHMLDLVLWLGVGAGYEIDSFRMSVNGEGKLTLASGALVKERRVMNFGMARGAGLDLERLELHGGGRSAQVTNLEQAVLSDRTIGKREESFGSWDSISYRRGFTGAIEHFLGSLDQPESCLIRAEQVLQTHILVEQLLSKA